MIIIASVLGQAIPVLGALEKRDYSYYNSQHLTARFGNSMVCGDHICSPGEWSKMQVHLNQAQISHGSGKNVTKTTPTTTVKTNSTSSTTSVNANSTSVPPVQPTPVPIPTPTPVPYSVCNTVKAVLTNSTISSSVITKIMTSLGCS